MIRNWSKEADVCDEFVLSAYEYYSVDTIAELLLPTGLLMDKSIQYAGSFESFVFLEGNKDETYTMPEIDFISSAGDIMVFTDFYKKTKRGIIPCRIVVARNSEFDSVEYSIAFSKIVNKASDGFNICVVFSEEGIIFTCRAYNGLASNNYYISEIIKTYAQMEEMNDMLMYSSDYDSFIDYYSYICESIRYRINSAVYTSKMKNTPERTYAYIDSLRDIETATGLDYSNEIERCLWSLEEHYEETYADRVTEVDNCLFRVESSRINTMEMLFEAEEMERLASEAEQRNEEMLMRNSSEYEKTEEMDTETKALLRDPESMIKHLKKERGI